MEDTTRYVSIAYMVVGIIVAWVLSRTFGLLLGTIAPAADIVLFGTVQLSALLGLASSGGLVWLCFSNERVSKYSNEVAAEMLQVAWPTGEETKRASYTVVVVSLLTAVCLFFTDFFWRLLTTAIFNS